MCVEIEAKLKVNSLSDVERKLTELGAEFVAEQLQSDSHLDDANAGLISTDRCLRLRRVIIESKVLGKRLLQGVESFVGVRPFGLQHEL